MASQSSQPLAKETGTLRPPNANVTVTPPVNGAALSLSQAQTILAGALSEARAKGYQPMGVVVLDASGNLKAFASEDGASTFRFEIARGKAWGAIGLGVSSRVLAERAKTNPNFYVALAAASDGKFLPQPGAVLIKDAAGRILGAAGASGGTGDEDEAICIAGVRSAGLVASD
jgi:uncharacterized protein GlcG (DUF336 family)